MRPAELTAWLEERMPGVSQRWMRQIATLRGGREGGVWAGILDEFVDAIARALPPTLGPFRDDIEPLWTRVAELFGSAAAWRGLAAGEVVEEMQLLRELVIRELYRDPPLGGRVPLSLRDVLRLNRAIDRAVTHASVGHTDAMFFQLFERGDAGDTMDLTTVAAEIREQLADMAEELAGIRAMVAGHTGSAEH